MTIFLVLWKLLLRYWATLSYVVLIVLINVSFVYMPLITMFGKTFSYADLTVGSLYVIRDFAQREIHHKVIIAMLIGAIISYFLATPTLAIASAASFLVAEGIDWAIFTFTKRPLSKRLVLSAIVSSPIDTLVFLLIIHRYNWLTFSLQSLVKFGGVYLVWCVWKIQASSQINTAPV